MDLKASFTKDKEGYHFVDSISGIGLHWKTAEDVQTYLTHTDGEPWEQSFRAALREIATQYPKLDQQVASQDFTVKPLTAETKWL